MNLSLTSFFRRLKAWGLKGALILIYFLLLMPVSLLKCRSGKLRIDLERLSTSESRWSDCIISSEEKEHYLRTL